MYISLNGNKSFTVNDLTVEETQFLKDTFSYKVTDKTWDYKLKKWNWHGQQHTVFIPKTINISTLEFRMGYIFAVMNIMYPRMNKTELSNIVEKFTNKELTIDNYYNLEDRNDCYLKLSTLLKYKRGILQIPTGQGKTEIIATIAKNILDKGERILIISETTPVLDEIRDRIRGLGVDVPNYFNKDSKINIIKPTGFCRNGLYNDESRKEYFNKVRYLIADEVETTVTNSFVKLFDDLVSCEYLYGFSASANKRASTDIPKDHSLTQIINPYVDNMVSYYGFTAIDSKPVGLNIDIRALKLPIKVHPDITERNMIIRKVFSSYSFINQVVNIVNNGELLFIPINNKDALRYIYQNEEIQKRKTLLISGDGYLVISGGNVIEKTTLDNCKKLIVNREVSLVLGTASSYRGLDFKGIDSILLTFDSQSAIMRQCIGRLTRKDSFSVYLVFPDDKISFLTSAAWSNYKEIKNYYSKCNLNIDWDYVNKRKQTEFN